MPVEQVADPFGVALGEVLDLKVLRGEWTVAKVGPSGDFQRLESPVRRPRHDVLQRAAGQTRGEKAEFHAGTSTQVWVAAD